MAAGSEQHSVCVSDAVSGGDVTVTPGPSHPSRQRRIAWLARSGGYVVNFNFFSTWFDLVTRLGAILDVSEHEEALPFDPLSSRR